MDVEDNKDKNNKKKAGEADEDKNETEDDEKNYDKLRGMRLIIIVS